MLPYFAIYTLACLGALSAPVRSGSLHRVGLAAFCVLLAAFVGLRHEVGVDWYNYLRQYDFVDGMPWTEVLLRPEPLHWGLYSYFSTHEFGIYALNCVYAAVFMFGLYRLCTRQPAPWMALLVAIPYLVIVVSMGYTRQAAAVGIVMVAISRVRTRGVLVFCAILAVAASFHRSAIVMMPLAFLLPRARLPTRWVAAPMLTVLAVGVFFPDYGRPFWEGYVIQNLTSSGGLVRVLLTACSGALVLVLRKRWTAHFDDYSFWRWMAILSLLSIPVVLVSSTAVDRLGLYFSIIQPVVFSRLPKLLSPPLPRAVLLLLPMVLYGGVMLVWFMFAIHSHSWLPYDNVLFR